MLFIRNLIKRLKAFFERKTLREKTLLCAIIWLFILTWLTLGLKRCQKVRGDLSQTSKDLAYQALWLSNAASIDASLKEVLSRLNPERTYTSSQLVGKVDRFAREAGIQHETSSPKTEQSEVFEIHSLTVSVKQAPMEKLIAFDEKLKKDFPYITLEDVRITGNKSNPTLLDARFTITSFELKKSLNADTSS